jgi:polar amino acid transport system substrate-binding protein
MLADFRDGAAGKCARASMRFLLTLLLALALDGRAAEPVQIAVDGFNPPFMSGSGAVARGLYPALIEASFKEMHRSASMLPMPWPRVMIGLDEQRHGAGGIYKTADRAKLYDFSEPLFVERIGVYYEPVRPVNYRSVADLAGLRVGVIIGWSYGDEFDRARKAGLFTVESVQSDLQNLRKLELGRIDVALIVIDSASSLFENGRFPSVARSERLLAENATYVAFHKDAHQRALLRDFNRALHTLHTSGAYDAIVARELAYTGK